MEHCDKRPGDRIRFFRDPDISGVELRHCLRTRQTFPNHTHGTYTVGLMDLGRCWGIKKGLDRFVVQAGEVMLINPEQVHSGTPTEDAFVAYRMLYVDRELVRDLSRDVHDGRDEFPEFSHPLTRNPALFATLARFHRVAGSGAESLEKESLLFSALSEIIARHTDHAPPRRRKGRAARAVTLAREYLADNVAEKVSLEELSNVAGVSRYHLLRMFRNGTGLPPHAFQTQLRVERAKVLLRKGWAPVQVAMETGFTDQSHFTHKFRQFTGITPRQYQTA